MDFWAINYWDNFAFYFKKRYSRKTAAVVNHVNPADRVLSMLFLPDMRCLFEEWTDVPALQLFMCAKNRTLEPDTVWSCSELIHLHRVMQNRTLKTKMAAILTCCAVSSLTTREHSWPFTGQQSAGAWSADALTHTSQHLMTSPEFSSFHFLKLMVSYFTLCLSAHIITAYSKGQTFPVDTKA